jgi:gliding motility-associated-like protein
LKTKFLIFLIAFLFAAGGVFAQSRGQITQAATPVANPMNPNGDGFVTATGAPFLPLTPTSYHVPEFELKMFGLPKVGGDLPGDNQNGPNCGGTDLIPDINGYSVYAAHGPFTYANNSTIDNVIFRFRIGDDDPNVQAWHILLDVDNRFGIGAAPENDPNANSTNPGFELDITLITKNNPGVFITYIDGISSCPTPYKSYPLTTNFQISVADLASCNNPDYFYDFFVTVNDLIAAYNVNKPVNQQITAGTGFRYVASTSTSATCAMGGSTSDIGGVDNDDPLYQGNDPAAYTAIVSNQCPTAVVSLCETCDGFNTGVTVKPTINPISVGDQVISGSTNPLTGGVFVKVSVYTSTGPGTWQPTPREEYTVSAPSGTWTAPLSGPLQNLDRIVAKVQLTADGSSICDGLSANSSTAFTVVSNLKPVANDQNLSTPEDTPLAITLTATDGNPGDVITYSVLTQPTHGTLAVVGASVTYTPNLNYNGPDSFTFSASDGIAVSNTATISITVTPVNDLPIANNQSVSTDEDTPLAITMVATDVDLTPLTYIIVTPPTNGTLSAVSGAGVTYTPNLNYSGPDSFTFKAFDGTADSNTATVSITVNPVNDAPVANNQNLSTQEDTPLPITLTASDVEGSSLVYTVVAQPTNGTLSGSGASLTYTPNLNYVGSDSFTFKVNDGTVDSNIATISINVTAVNDAPVATNQSLTTPEDTPLPITLSATDVDPLTTLTYTIVTPPANGTLSAVAGAGVTYTPNANFNGADSFTFRANDGSLNSNTATIFITVTPVNDAPVANSQSVNVPEDVTSTITLTASDVDGDPLTYILVTPPTNGTVSLTSPNVFYTPNANYTGPDSFTFKVNDGTVDSNIATVTINVTPVNDAPVASNQSVSTNEDTPLPITLVATDVDVPTTLTYTILTLPINGTLSCNNCVNPIYTPNPNYNGPDSFTFSASDGFLTSNTATVSITVIPVNDAPVANNQTIIINEDVTVAITLTASDVDGDPLTYSIVANPTNGTLSGTAPNVSYTPNSNYNGSDSFTFKVNDGTVDSNIATVTITINAINDAPVASDKSVTTAEDTALPITLVATDVDGTPLTYSIVTQPTNGTLSAVSGSGVTYTPNPNYNGPDSFTFRANDGTVNSNTATVSITVTPVNDAPVANSQSVTVNEDASVNITLTASDIDNDPLTYSIVTGPANGTISGTLPNITYTPDPDYSGPDSFTFKVNDGTTDSNTATVTITVTPINDAPVAFNAGYQYLQNTPLNLVPPLNAFDADGDPLTFTILTFPLPSEGVLSGTAPGSLIFTPALNFAGTSSFTFKVNDGTVDSNIATVTLNLNTGVNYPPIAQPLNVTVVEDGNVNIVLDASDANGDPLTYIIVSGPSNGTLTPAPPGTAQVRNYQPNPNYNGLDSFTYKANDGTVDGNIVTVNITVTPVNDVPVANNQTVNVIEDTDTPITLTGSDIENDQLMLPLTFTVLTQPTNGTLSGTGANLTYTPNANYNGPDAFTFKVNDGTVDSAPGTVSISVNPVNDVPVAAAQNLTTPEDTPLPIILTGTDTEGSALTYSVVTLPGNGSLSCTNCANPIYTPNLNYNGNDSFTFKVNDGTVDSAPATITINVTPVNDAPIANNQTVAVIEDTPKVITLTGSDVENSPLTFTIVTPPTNGVLSGVTGANVTYTPNANYNGPDAFTFKVNDGNLDSAPATVSITVSPVNDVPVAIAQNLTTPEDTQLAIVLTGTDNDGNPLTYAVVTPPANGILSCLNCASPTYKPNPNYNGPDSFTFKVNDGTADSAPATISITVTPVNDAPVVNNQTVVVTEDIAEDITLTGSDIEGTALTFTILTQPSNGTLTATGSNATWTYTPNLNYFGPDGFTFKASDGQLDSNTGTVSITVESVNDLPVAINDLTITTNEDTPVSFPITTNDTDVDGVINPATVDLDPFTPAEDKTLTTAQGVYTVNASGIVTFTPVLNYNGTTTPITYTVKDNEGGLSNVAQIQIIVLPVNDAPVVVPEANETNEDTPIVICFEVTDIENDPSVLSGVVSLGGHGTVTIDANAGPFCFLYTPDPDYNGPDQVQVTVCDANDPTLCTTGVIDINVLPINDAPRIIENGVSVSTVTRTTPEDTPVTFCFDVIDPDGDLFTGTIGNNISGGGTMVFETPGPGQLCVTFTPALNFNGVSTWPLTICDDADPSLCGTFTVEIEVTPVNDKPVADSQNVTTIEDIPLAITLTGSDVDGDVLTYTVVGIPLNGTLTGTGPNVTYTPNLDYTGPDSFTFKVNDGTIDSDVVTVNITVTPQNDKPIIIAAEPNYTTEEDTPLEVCFFITDPDAGDVITFSNPVNIAGGGTMTIGDGGICFDFTPAKDFNGQSIWKFEVCDNGNPKLCSDVTITIVVTPVNDPPVAVDDNLTVQGTEANVSINLLDNDFDVDGDDLIITTTALAGPFHGSITINADGSINYQAEEGYVGADSVRYKVCDDANPSLCDEGVLFIDVDYPKFKIYNALSPNNDGMNDFWRIDGIENYPDNKARIFDRYNNLIFEMAGYDNDENSWRGQANHGNFIKGNMPEGTYFYTLQVDLGNGMELFSGYLVLKKE